MTQGKALNGLGLPLYIYIYIYTKAASTCPFMFLLASRKQESGSSRRKVGAEGVAHDAHVDHQIIALGVQRATSRSAYVPFCVPPKPNLPALQWQERGTTRAR